MSGIEAANKMGLPVFCMAYKAGLGIYSRCGFKEVERIIQDTAQWGFEGAYGAYFMVYDNPNPSWELVMLEFARKLIHLEVFISLFIIEVKRLNLGDQIRISWV